MPPLTFFPDQGDTEMSAGTVIASSAKAAQACVPCRKQKRKCDKGLPACGLCSRMGRICGYTDVQQAPTAEDLMSMQMKIVELEQRLNQKEQQNGNSVTLRNGQGNSTEATSAPSPSFLNIVNEKPSLWMPAQSKFPSAMFLDIDCFTLASIPVPRPAAEIPMVLIPILLLPSIMCEFLTETLFRCVRVTHLLDDYRNLMRVRECEYD
jgi:hypothetical protein